jgi:hypothetical protein
MGSDEVFNTDMDAKSREEAEIQVSGETVGDLTARDGMNRMIIEGFQNAT